MHNQRTKETVKYQGTGNKTNEELQKKRNSWRKRIVHFRQEDLQVKCLWVDCWSKQQVIKRLLSKCGRLLLTQELSEGAAKADSQ